MNYEEAVEWLEDKRSMTNIIPQEPLETWQVRIAQADAAMVEQAYWVIRAHIEFNKTIKENINETETNKVNKYTIWEESMTDRYPES